MTEAMHNDVTIVGAGLVGLSLANALGQAGMAVTVLDASAPASWNHLKPDGRTCAIAHGGKQIFSGLDVWNAMQPHAGPIWDIRITDAESPLFLHYRHSDVGSEPMGYILENRHTRQALLDGIRRFPNVTLLAPAKWTSLEQDSHHAHITTDTGQVLHSKLLVAADGKRSLLRQHLDIPVDTLDYHQTAIVCTVEHTEPHQGVAVEKFLPAGPFAILPMANPHHSSLVWTEKTGLAPHFLAMNPEDFTTQLHKRFAGYLGDITPLEGRWSYPLSLSLARRYHEGRTVLLGDAAHAMHPIAGQGFNLSLRDVAVLAETLADHWRLGLDIGNKQVFDTFLQLRQQDILQLLATTDALNRLFSNAIPPLALARKLGLAAVQQLPILKRFFIRHAMGTVGYQSRLMRGETL